MDKIIDYLTNKTLGIMKKCHPWFIYILSILFVLTACNINTKEISSSDNKIKAGNPIITEKYTADPAAMVYNDTVYLYVGHDQAALDLNFYDLREWMVFIY
jgi:hypothetical protein